MHMHIYPHICTCTYMYMHIYVFMLYINIYMYIQHWSPADRKVPNFFPKDVPEYVSSRTIGCQIKGSLLLSTYDLHFLAPIFYFSFLSGFLVIRIFCNQNRHRSQIIRIREFYCTYILTWYIIYSHLHDNKINTMNFYIQYIMMQPQLTYQNYDLSYSMNRISS